MSSIDILEEFRCPITNINFRLLYYFRFPFRIQVCRTPDDNDDWFEYAMTTKHDQCITRFALDIKYDHQNRPAILQFCAGRTCLVYQFHLTEEIPGELKHYLDHPECLFVGDGIKKHAENLLRMEGIKVRNIIDVRDVVADYLEKECPPSMDLESIAREVLGVEIERPEDVRLSNWTGESLTLDQIKYATTEVITLHETFLHPERQFVYA